MKIKELTSYMLTNQEVSIWSDRFVETMYTGSVSEMSETVLAQEVKLIQGSYIPNVLQIVIY